MQAVWELYGRNPFKTSSERLPMFNKVCGSDYVSKTFGSSMMVDDILEYWNADAEAFKALSSKYYLY